MVWHAQKWGRGFLISSAKLQARCWVGKQCSDWSQGCDLLGVQPAHLPGGAPAAWGNGHCWHRAWAKKRRNPRSRRGSVGEKQAWRRWAGCRNEVLLWENKVLHLQHILVCILSFSEQKANAKSCPQSLHFPALICWCLTFPFRISCGLFSSISEPLVLPGVQEGQCWWGGALEFAHPASDPPALRHCWNTKHRPGLGNPNSKSLAWSNPVPLQSWLPADLPKQSAASKAIMAWDTRGCPWTKTWMLMQHLKRNHFSSAPAG